MLLEAFGDDFDDDDFGDDIDMETLVQVTETVEQTHAAGQISFVPTDDDPPPPPALPRDTPSAHRFEPEEMRTWVYPTNYPIRGYQLNIVHKAMFNNILVALPTGLGKTFIAAVVMYNYWRWFPDSKIIFLAHTRPLVDQQIEACFTICGIPQDQTAEMTGDSKVEKRRELWKNKRVFFATPQTVQNDLKSKICPGHLVSCVVLDEAHKATGNYAYTEVVRRIYKVNKNFRILALTATPGSTVDAVQNVVTNLHISKIEIRTEESMDIRQFSHGKNIQRIVVKLGYTEGSTGILPRIISDYSSKVFEPLLVDLSRKPTSVSPSPKSASAFGLRSLRLRFQAEANNLNKNLKWAVLSLFHVAESASRAYEYLTQFGVAPFIESIESLFAEYDEKRASGGRLTKAQSAFQNNSALNGILRYAKQEAQKPDFIGHPKLDHLISILLNHFGSLSDGEVSKVMIFSSFRSSVMDIRNVLDRHRPMIRSTIFVGQASDKQGTKGLNQREQQEVLRKFKSDEFNVLVATSIGEEGLDIGEIDLIICFDSHSSPIRMLQRMGRTGRKRMGKCILLHTEEEEKKFNKAKDAYASVQRMIARDGIIKYFKPEPQMLPANYKPTICRKQLIVGTYQPKIMKRRNKKAESTDYTQDGFLQDEVERSFIRTFCSAHSNYTSMDQITAEFWPIDKTTHSISKFVPLQSRLQTTYRVGHSKRALQLSKLVEKMEYRIMHPDEKINVQIPKQMTQLKLPSKFSKNTLTMPTPRKRRKAPSNARLDDDDLENFMQSTNIDQIVDIPVPDDQDAGNQPLPQPVMQQQKVNKGKSKMTLSQEMREVSEVIEDMDVDASQKDSSPPSWDNEPRSWEQMLPDSVFEDIDPLPDLHHQEPSIQTPLTNNAQRTPTPPSLYPFNHLPSPEPLKQSASLMSENEFGDEFDVSLDASFLEQADALVKSKTELGFDDALEPRFDFEKTSSASGKKMTVALTWPGHPPFTEKGLKLLEERQKRLEARTGHRILMQFKKPAASATVATAIPLRKQQDKAQSTLATTTSHEKQQLDHSMEEREEEDEFDDLNFNEDMFANFLENKIDEDGYYAENFMYGQNETTTQNIAEQSILHVDTVADRPTNHDSIALSYPQNAHTTNTPRVKKRTQSHSQKHQWFGDTVAKEEDIIEFDVDALDALSSSSEGEAPHAQPAANIHGALQKQPSIFSIEDSQEIPSQKKQDEDVDPSGDEIAASPIIHRRRRNIIISEDEQESPSLLSALSKGLYTPSPLHRAAESESPVLIRRKLKRPLIEDEEDDKQMEEENAKVEEVYDDRRSESKGRKRLKRKVTNDEDDDFVVLPPSQHELKKRLLQSREPSKKKFDKNQNSRHRKAVKEGGLVNPFVEYEAEYSSDGGHTDEDVEGLFNSSASSLLNSFIDDDDQSSVGHSSAVSALPPMVLRTPDDDDPIRRIGKHWMNRFNADKWLNINEEEDSVVVSDEEVGDEESITDFTSDLRENLILPAADDNDDDDDDDDDGDFM
ncbi:hypothetical protein HMPREF1544_01725 [Mucor circinelloides 1006PhL]|uniref:ATP-dependent DNA helicase n=1 Tax=Mucor circinelloides f. circinelloides (strain 1006PhL) TaxID=1220926 RepID=S2JN91_MUCC1|nr:hypothetical protein HMPREF1544_01725 [Mucor circinelloides 1006PhL]